MMIDKNTIQQAIRQTLSDRSMLMLLILMMVVGFTYAIAVAINIHPSDVTAYTRYTAFGEAHFYKNHWQYFIAFMLFGPLVAITHASLAIKLYAIERRQTALLVSWAGIAIIVVAFMYVMAVMGLGNAT